MIINMVGGGASLNFDVKAYATEAELLAATPKENTIGIISTTEMTGWIIDANQPKDLTDGMAWISVGTSSAVEFNALKKGGLQVYPLRTKQMVDGNLVNVDAMIYQGGKWNNLVRSLMNQVKAFAVKSTSNEAWVGKAPSIVNQNNELVLSISASSYPYPDGIVGTEELIDATNYRELTVGFSTISLSKGYDYASSVTIYVLDNLPTTGYASSCLAKAVAFSQKTAGSKNDITVSIPLDGITGECFIGIGLACTYEGGTATLSASVKEWDLK